MKIHLNTVLVGLSLVFPLAANGANSVPVLRLTKKSGYGRIVQEKIQLQAGRSYQFKCRIWGAYRSDHTDHVPEFRGPKPVMVSRPKYLEQDGWTLCTSNVHPKESGSYSLVMATWNWNEFEVTQISLVDSSSGEDVVRNGTLNQGLSHWNSEGGRLTLSQITSLQRPRITLQGQTVSYTRFDGAKEELSAYRGKNILLLIPPISNTSPTEIRRIVGKLDKSWAYYRDLTGRGEPFSGNRISINGQNRITVLPTLAAVEATCGAGCGLVGYAGIEVGRGTWLETYRNHLQRKETRGVFEYEMGRNFWFYGHILQSPDTPRYHLATAFATIYGYLAGVTAGSTTQPGNELVDWVQEYRDAFNQYQKDPDFARIKNGGQKGEKIIGGLWLHLGEKHGPEFHQRFFRAANELPPAINLQAALSNFVIASSIAANTNLYDFFSVNLKYPLPRETRKKLGQRFGSVIPTPIWNPPPKRTAPVIHQSTTNSSPNESIHRRRGMSLIPLNRHTLRLGGRLE